MATMHTASPVMLFNESAHKAILMYSVVLVITEIDSLGLDLHVGRLI